MMRLSKEGLHEAPRCVIATCAQLPQLDPDDRLLADALTDLGASVTAAVWNDSAVDWSAAQICLVRSTWDYHKRYAAFARWVDATSASTCLLNPAHVVHWNSHKFYLRDLQNHGVPVVPTLYLERGASVELRTLLDSKNWAEGVIKPAFGASAEGILRVGSSESERDSGERYLHQLLVKQDVLLQPYLNSIAEQHERALVFIDGAYSHAVTKMPFMHANSDLALRALHPPGASGELPIEATAEEIAVASLALDASPAGHVYARVDVVRDAGAIRVLEVELIEPTLYLYAHPPAAHRLAGAVLARAAG